MISSIDISEINKDIYTGQFDASVEGKQILLELSEPILIDLNIAVSSNIEVGIRIGIEDLRSICSLSAIKANIYPNGNISFQKLSSSRDELKTCYLSFAKSPMATYVICIAFDEIQPTLYKAQLLDIYLFQEK